MSEIPDIYSDQFNMAMSPYGIALTFSLSPSMPSALPNQVPATPQAVVRMSLEHAKVLAMMLRRNIKQYELEALGDPVKLPQATLAQLHLSDSDW